MNFPQAVTNCFKEYGTFSGRAARSEYWYWFLFCFLAGIVLPMLDIAFFHVNIHDRHAFYPLKTVFSIMTFLPGLAVAARRLHDTNHSGWWMLLMFTVIGVIPLLIWFCTKSTGGDNRFGSNPLNQQ